jgi:hypothetical protein
MRRTIGSTEADFNRHNIPGNRFLTDEKWIKKTDAPQKVKVIRVEHSASILLLRQLAADIPESNAQSITDAAPDRCVHHTG